MGGRLRIGAFSRINALLGRYPRTGIRAFLFSPNKRYDFAFQVNLFNAKSSLQPSAGLDMLRGRYSLICPPLSALSR